MEAEKKSTPKALAWVYERSWLTVTLKTLSHIISIYAIFIFAWLSFTYSSLGLLPLIKLLLSLGVPFAILSLVRRILDSPRPYEVYDIYEAPPKNKCGRSFPSRHVFSAFLIGVASLSSLPVLGASLILLATVLSACRVLTGIHFIRDCAAGALSGILCGVLALLII